jgi:dTDP-4-amino-4,6-dideoxygalactose transaminase
MQIEFVDLKKQYLSIKQEIDHAIQQVILNSAYIGGKEVSRFEENFAAYIGTKHAVSCANGTDSIEIIFSALGIGKGDEVIVPAHSWISTSEAISAVGATPIFVDTLPLKYTIDPSKIETAITTKTKAIMPVHLCGLPAEMDEIMAIAKKHKLVVIEDCAQAHGAEYKGKKIGTFGTATSFSFYPGKNLGAYGDAGGITTNDDALAERARMIANHGQKGKHNHVIEGRNSRLDGLQAAVLTVKLKYLNQWTDQRIANAMYYMERLKNKGIALPELPSYSKHVFHLFVIQCEERDVFMKELSEKGISTAVHYPTILPLLTAYSKHNYKAQQFAVSATYQSKIVSLPMYAELTKQEIEYVAECVGICASKGVEGINA